MTRDKFFSNLKNKAKFISYLEGELRSNSVNTRLAKDDADVLIVRTAIEVNENFPSSQVVVIGQDADLLTLLVALTPRNYNITMKKEAQGSVSERLYSSRDIQISQILKEPKNYILLAHAFSGCDTTSCFYGMGKSKILK